METNCPPEKYLQLNDPSLCRWMIIATKLAHFLLNAFEVIALRLRDYLSAKEEKIINLVLVEFHWRIYLSRQIIRLLRRLDKYEIHKTELI